MFAEYGDFVAQLEAHRGEVARDLERGRGPMGLRFAQKELA